MRIVSVEAEAWTLALRAPFVIAARTAHTAQNVRVTVRTDHPGLCGLGESAPVGYVTGESVETVVAALDAVGPQFHGDAVTRLGPLLDKANSALPEAPAARAGLEMALYDVWARYWRLSLWQHFGARQAQPKTDLTIPIVPPEEAFALTEAARHAGFESFKIKVGDPQGPEADLGRIVAVAEAAPQAGLRIDANQAFSPEGAIRFAQSLRKSEMRVELLEQPVAKEDIDGLRHVKAHSPFPVFADEAARDISSVLHLLREDAVDGINLKLMKSGIGGALQIMALCQAAGKPLMLGCMLESPLGIAAAAQIAGGTGSFAFLDLDSPRLLSPVPGLSGGFTGDSPLLPCMTDTPGWGVHFSDVRAK